MHRLLRRRAARSLLSAVVAAGMMASTAVATHGDTHVELQLDTKGCNGVLPSTDGNTDMRLIGGTLEPGGTAIFAITYPLDATSVGKEFTITACAFISGVATLKYLVSFVPSNEAFVLQMTFAVPVDASVGAMYCNYAKTTRSPTAAQASQRKAGPACFIIRAPSTTSTVRPPGVVSPPPPTAVPGSPGSPASPGSPSAPGGGSTVSGPILLPDTAVRPPR